VPSATGSPTGKTLFAVLELKHPDPKRPWEAFSELAPIGAPDTVVIAASDGYAVARAAFAPRSIPDVGPAGVILQLPAQVADGAVFYIDGKGVVRRLDPSGAVKVIATFPITSTQQEVSFAVSPDGQHLMATVLTLPTPVIGTNGTYRLQLETATAGGATTVVQQWQSQGTDPSQWDKTNFAVVGWDADGPIAEVGAGGIATQNAWLDGQRWFVGWLARVGADGSIGARIGPDCLPFWRPLNGRFVCTVSGNSGTGVQVVDVKGHVLWGKPTLANSGTIGPFYPSPDGTKVAMTGSILLANGSMRSLSASFRPQGWTDNGTVIGWVPTGQSVGGVSTQAVALFHVDTGQLENWGFAGTFVGTVR
jgi:hypothetical protein